MCMCWKVGKSLKADAPGGAKTHPSAYLAQHLQSDSAYYSKGVNYTKHDCLPVCVPTFHKLRTQ